MNTSKKPGTSGTFWRRQRALRSAIKIFAGLETLELRMMLSGVAGTVEPSDLVAGAAITTTISAALTPGTSGVAKPSDALPDWTSTTTVWTYNSVLAGVPVDLWVQVVPSTHTQWMGTQLTFMVDGVALDSQVYTTTSNTLAAHTTTTFSTPGTHQVTASFSGVAADADGRPIEGSTSAPFTVNVVSAPDEKAAVSLTLDGPTPPSLDAPISFVLPTFPLPLDAASQTIRANVISDVPLPLSGSISLYDSDTLLATLPVVQSSPPFIFDLASAFSGSGSGNFNSTNSINRGSATFTVSTGGTHHLRAVYSGDDARLGASATGTLVMTGGRAYDVNLSGLSSAAPNTPFMLTAVVMPTAGDPGSAHPEGTVTFWEGGEEIGSATLDASGHATLSISESTSGIHAYSAFYQDENGLYGSTLSGLAPAQPIFVSLGSRFSGDTFTGLTVAIGTPNELYVAQLYHDLLNRMPDVVGAGGWVSRLDGGESRTSVVAGFLASQEFETLQIGYLYHSILQRAGADSEIAGWVSRMGSGLSLDDVKLMMVASDEFYANHFSPVFGTPNPDVKVDDAYFINHAYQILLNRKAEIDAINAWAGVLDYDRTHTGTILPVPGPVISDADYRFEMLTQLAQSPEYATLVATAFYTVYLRRPVEDGGGAGWIEEARHLQTTKVLSEFLASDEYFNGLDSTGKPFYSLAGSLPDDDFLASYWTAQMVTWTADAAG